MKTLSLFYIGVVTLLLLLFYNVLSVPDSHLLNMYSAPGSSYLYAGNEQVTFIKYNEDGIAYVQLNMIFVGKYGVQFRFRLGGTSDIVQYRYLDNGTLQSWITIK